MVQKAITICNHVKMVWILILQWFSQKRVRTITTQDRLVKLNTHITSQSNILETIFSSKRVEFRENLARISKSTVGTTWLSHKMLAQVLRRVVIWVDQILSRDTEILEMVCKVLQTRAKWTWTIIPPRPMQVDSHRSSPMFHLRATSLAIKAIEVAEMPLVKIKLFLKHHLNIKTLRHLLSLRISTYLIKQTLELNLLLQIRIILQTLKIQRQWERWATRAIVLEVLMKMKRCWVIENSL